MKNNLKKSLFWQSISGFTLLEILVAISIIFIGFMGISFGTKCLIRIKEMEHRKNKILMDSISLMENYIKTSIECFSSVDTVLYKSDNTDFIVVFSEIPGDSHLQWVSIRENTQVKNNVVFKRVVQCLKKEDLL